MGIRQLGFERLGGGLGLTVLTTTLRRLIVN